MLNDYDAIATVAVKNLESATNEDEKLKDTQTLSTTFMTEFPYVVTVYAPDRLIYRMDHAVGWPSTEDPYASGGDRMLWLPKLRAP